MPILDSIFLYGVIFSIVVNLYLFIIMVTLSPRIWAYSDYPKSITDGVPPPTKREKMIGGIIGIPFFILTLGIPIISTLNLESSYPGTIPLLDAFLNIYGILLIGNITEVLVLDILIVGTITPSFVIIPGTEHLKDTEYKAFRIHHGKAHLRAIVGMAILSILLAFVMVLV